MIFLLIHSLIQFDFWFSSHGGDIHSLQGGKEEPAGWLPGWLQLNWWGNLLLYWIKTGKQTKLAPTAIDHEDWLHNPPLQNISIHTLMFSLSFSVVDYRHAIQLAKVTGLKSLGNFLWIRRLRILAFWMMTLLIVDNFTEIQPHD